MIGTGIGLGLSGYRLKTGSFEPRWVSGLQLWFDADDSSTLLQSTGGSAASADGDPVGYWADKSGNNRHATQSDGTKKPAFRTGVKNGKNVVRWDATNDSLETAFSAISQPTTYFIVFKYGRNNSFLFDGAGGTTRQAMFFDSNQFNLFAGPQYKVGTPQTVFQILELQFNSTNSKIYLNSLLLGTGNPGTQGIADLTLGNSIPNLYNYSLGGDIAEFILYNSILSEGDRNSVQTYLNTKWGIY